MPSKKIRFLLLPGESSKAREVNLSKRQIVFLSSLVLTVVIGIFLVTANLLSTFIYKQKLKAIEHEKNVLNSRITELDQKAKNLETDISVLFQRDDDLRVFADIPSISEDEKEMGVGGSIVKELKLSNFFETEEERYNQLSFNIDKLERMISLERKSYEDLINGIEKQVDRRKYIPSIRPVNGGRTTDRFDWRKHPLTGKRQFHKGIDISIPRGSEVYAAADGTVVMADYNGGFGKYIKVDHESGKYGFQTGYGHLSRFNVKKGQKVKRGEVIGFTGGTGTSTAPHLHYEVIFNGQKVDPMLWYFDPAVLR